MVNLYIEKKQSIKEKQPWQNLQAYRYRKGRRGNRHDAFQRGDGG